MSKKPQRGFSLVEILISVLVISFGLLSLAGLQVTSVKGVNNAHSQNIASMLTMELSERMRANPQGVAQGYYGTSIDCAASLDQCRGDKVCSAEQTALFDLQEVMCGTTINGTSQGGARNLLPQGSLSVVCAGGCDQADIAHRITVSWSNNIVHESQGEASEISTLITAIIP